MKTANAALKTSLTALYLVLFCMGLAGAAVVPAPLEAVKAKDNSVWVRVNEPGFGSTANMSVVAMAEYNGRLYAMTRNQATGAQVWRTSGTGWEQLTFPGQKPNLNNVWARMIVFQGKLYFGLSSGLQGAYLGSSGCEIWRYFDNETTTYWEPVIADDLDTDNNGTITAIAGCADGDGDVTAQITDSTKTWTPNEWAGGTLQIASGSGQYRKFRIISNTADTLTIQQNEAAGTYNSSGQETEFTICASKQYDNPFPLYSYTLGAVAVGDSYEIGIGSDENGFGVVWNKTITAMRIFDGKLYVSTGLNYEYGGQVWYTANGNAWFATESVLPVSEPYVYHSFGNYHADTAYPGGYKPVSSSVTDLAVSSVSGAPVLYAGGTGTGGSQGGCARMAKLTNDGWEMIVDRNVDGNDTGTNENGFGSSPTCSTNKENFMPWSLADFDSKLLVGIVGDGARVMYSTCGCSADGLWFYSVGGTSSYPNGFDGYKYTDGNWQNLGVNLSSFGNLLYGGIVTQYVPEYGIPPVLSQLKGSQIWKSSDGLAWTQVTDNGLDDAQTIIFEAFTGYDNALYVSGSKGASSTPSGLGGAKVFRQVPTSPQDTDGDGVLNASDLCAGQANGPQLGTCTTVVGGVVKGTGVPCVSSTLDCMVGETCQMTQEDMNANGIGDVCECYADANNDGKVILSDLVLLKSEFGRTNCATVPCQADFNGDNKVILSDLVILKGEFGKTGCPTVP